MNYQFVVKDFVSFYHNLYANKFLSFTIIVEQQHCIWYKSTGDLKEDSEN